MRYLILLLLIGCSSNLTKDEQLDRDYEENDRKALYRVWEEACIEADGTVYAHNPSRPCLSKRNCIPHRWDWDYDHESERPDIGNRVMCVSRGQVDSIMRSATR